MCGKENTSALLVGLHTGAASVENSIEFPQKIKYVTAFWPSHSTAWIITQEPQNTNSKEPMHTYVHSNIIYNNKC